MAVEERKKRRGSILDLVLIFLLILSALGIAFRWQQIKGLSAEQSYKEYRLVGHTGTLHPDILRCVENGEALYTASGEYYGRLKTVHAMASRVTLFSEGKYLSAEWDPQKKTDLYVEVIFEGTERGGRILRNGRSDVMIGQTVTLYSEYAVLHILIDSVSAVTE